MDADAKPDEIESLVEDFFTAPHAPASNHEEWLLRTCARLMEREATAVSVAECERDQIRDRRRRGDR